MKVILRDHRPDHLRGSYGLGLDALLSRHVAGGEPRVSSFVSSVLLHVACIPVIIAGAELLAPAPRWKPPFPAQTIILRLLPKKLYAPITDQSAIQMSPASDALLRTAARRLMGSLGIQDQRAVKSSRSASPTNRLLIRPRVAPEVELSPGSPPVPSLVLLSSHPGSAPLTFELRAVPSSQPAVELVQPSLGTQLAAISSTPIDMGQTLPNIAIAPVPQLSAPAKSNGENGISPGRSVDVVTLLSVSPDPLSEQAIIVPPGNILPAPSASPVASPDTPGQGNKTAPKPFALVPNSDGLISDSPATNNSEAHKTSSGNAVIPYAHEGTPQHRFANALPPRRIEHPANGRFDVIVIQTSLSDILPATVGLMKGKPVYSVYLGVGEPKEWILHYCASDAGIVQRGAVVQLPDPAPVTAPYPAVTIRPETPMTGPGSYLLVHGSLDESGKFRDLKVVGQGQARHQELLLLLSHWRFRPAFWRNSPVAVEIVLAIPTSKT